MDGGFCNVQYLAVLLCKMRLLCDCNWLCGVRACSLRPTWCCSATAVRCLLNDDFFRFGNVVLKECSKHLVVRVPVLGPASGPGTKSPQPKPNCEASPLRSSFRVQKMDPESGPQRVRKTGVPVRGCLRKRWVLLSGKCPFVSRGLGITVGRAVGRPLDFA